MDHILNEADIRSVVALLGEALGGDGDFSQKRADVFQGIADLIGSTSWFSARTMPDPETKLAKFTIMVKGGFTEEQFAAYLESQRHPDMAWVAAPIFEAAGKSNRRATRRDDQMHSIEKLRAAGVSTLLARAGIGPVIMSCRITEGGIIGAAMFFRAADQPLFTDRESKIVHIVLSEVEWLHDNSWPKYPNEKFRSLPSRFNGILNLLLDGVQRKDIAEKLNLSPHTVSDYIKDVYDHFEVHSRAELIHRFTRGDGGDLVS